MVSDQGGHRIAVVGAPTGAIAIETAASLLESTQGLIVDPFEVGYGDGFKPYGRGGAVTR